MSNARDIVERLENEAKFFEQTLVDDTVDLIREAATEIARLREGRKPVAWCVQAAAGSMFHAWTHTPIDASVLIQCKDDADASLMASVYGHKVLGVFDLDAKEVPRG